MPLARDLNVSELRADISAVLRQVEMQEVRRRLMRHGKAVGALVTLPDLAALEAVEAQSTARRWERIAQQGQRQDWLAEAQEKARRGEDVTWR